MPFPTGDAPRPLARALPPLLSAPLLALLLASSCRSAGHVEGSPRFADESWDDGLAVVCVFEGRLSRYGTWRDAEVRDYMVREYLDPGELTKRDAQAHELVPVLKANRQVEFATGAYDYRLMSSLFFRRDTGELYKGVGSCLNACGLVYQRWDRPSGALRWDSYWQGEGRAETELPAGDWHFADELPFVAPELADGARIRVLPPLASPRAMLSLEEEAAGGEALVPGPTQMWLGIGDQCTECVLPPEGAREGASGRGGPRRFSSPTSRELVVEHDGRRTRFLDATDGALALELVHDEQGFLEAWTLPGEQEFRRVAVFHGPYWERTAPSDRGLVSAR